MSKQTHTPGPWAIYRQPLRNRIHACWELTRLVFGTKSFVPSMPMIVGQDGKCPAVTGCGAKSEANARLIAAAPELLEALKRFVEDHQEYGDDCRPLPPEEQDREVAAGMRAIAKARGDA